MDRFERAKAATAGMTAEQKVLFAVKAADAVFARRYGDTAHYRAQWLAFLDAPFGRGAAREVAVTFPCDPRSDEYVAAQRAGAAALQLERGNVALAEGLAERVVAHALAAERGCELVDIDAIARGVRVGASACDHAAE